MDTIKQAKINLLQAQRGKLGAQLAKHDAKSFKLLAHMKTIDAKIASMKSTETTKE
jgi:hypothetical protein